MFHTLGVMKQRVARQPGETENENRISGEYEVLRLADKIVAATPAEQAQLQWLYRAETEKIVIIPPGVDTSRFYPIPTDEAKEFIGVQPCENLCLFVGRIEPLKGIDILIDALAILRQQGMEMCLSIIGGDPNGGEEGTNVEMERLQAIREKAGMQDFIAFLGKRNQDTLPYYYSAAEAVVVPSQYESFGMVAMEAMACGTPVVASQVGGLAFLVQDNVTGFTVPVDEPAALAEKLAILMTDPNLRQQMGEQAAEFAKEYAWEKIASRILKVYSAVLG
jgi:D-inositol-3-phosphate glycosyltransferase